MNEKKKLVNNPPPIHSIVRGEVRADIFVRQSNSGYLYHDYTLGRFFKSRSTSKESKSISFFGNNSDDLIQAVLDASAWIQEQAKVVFTGKKSTDTNQKIVGSNCEEDCYHEKES